MSELDHFDRKILKVLMTDGRATMSALADEVALSATQCARRLARMEDEGIVSGYRVRLDRRKIGLGVVALVNVSLERQGENLAREFQETISNWPEVIECLLLTGDADYQLRVMEKDLDSYAEFVTTRLMRLPGVANIRSSIVIGELKSEAPVPL